MGILHQRKSSLMTARPGGPCLGGVKSVARLPTETFVTRRDGRFKNAVENRPCGGNNGRHSSGHLQSVRDLNEGPGEQDDGRTDQKNHQREQEHTEQKRHRIVENFHTSVYGLWKRRPVQNRTGSVEPPVPEETLSR